MKIVAISDTHSMHDRIEVPDGDVLIHAGDFTGSTARQAEDMVAFNDWLGTLPHRVKIVVPGNHDKMCEVHTRHARSLLTNATMLIDEGVTVDGVRFYGSPWTPIFQSWYFMRPRGTYMADMWARIPEGTDVLITHGPPEGILDAADGRHVGCEELRKRVEVVRPKFHVFGHIHEGAGEETLGETRFINASNCTGAYRPINPARVFEIEVG